MAVDLHSHSTASDGSFSPSELARAFAAHGVRIAGLTDHDTVGGVSEFLEACEQVGIAGLGGIEFSTVHREVEVHLLGYGLPLDDPRCAGFLRRHYAYLRGRCEAMLRKLAGFGFEVPIEEVYRISDGNPPMPPHIIRTIAYCGLIPDLPTAINFFWEYLAADAKAWVPHETPLEAPLGMLNEVGAIAIVAHPFRLPDTGWLEEILEMGADGFELYYPGQTGPVFDDLKAIAEKRGCLVAGGCDYHGAFAERKIREIEVPWEVAKRLYEAVGEELPASVAREGGEVA